MRHDPDMIFGNKAFGQGNRSHFLGIDSPTVIRNLHHHLASFIECPQFDEACFGFSIPHPHIRHFNSMIHGISNQMVQGITHGFQQRPIQFDFRTLHFNRRFFSQFQGQIPYHSRKPVEQAADRVHACQHDHFLKVGGDGIHPFTYGFGDFHVIGGNRLEQLISSQNQFPGKIHQRIQEMEVHTDGSLQTFGNGLSFGSKGQRVRHRNADAVVNRR